MTARERLSSRVDEILSAIAARPTAQRERLLHLCLIHFSAIGAKMVAKADVWLTSWGAELLSTGYPSIGASHLKHATEERGHDEWHRRDVRTLVRLYEERYGHRFSAEAIIDQGRAPCVERYEALSERRVGNGNARLSIAELYETELLAAAIAPKFIGYCVRELGFGIMKGLVFLQGHVAADVDHIKENAVQLDALLRPEPTLLGELIEVGEETVAVYEDYFAEIWRRAQGAVS